MAEHAGRQARLLDFGVAVHDAADPAQIDVQWSDRTAAERDAGRGAVVCDGVENLALILNAGVDDLDRRDDIFGGAQHVSEPNARAEQPLAHDESQFDLDPRFAVIGVLHLGAVGDHLVVEDEAEIRLIDHRRTLHRLGGQAHFVADQLGAGRDLAVRDLGRDRIGILDGDAGKGHRQLDRLFAFLLRRHENIGRFAAIGIGKHWSSLPVSLP